MNVQSLRSTTLALSFGLVLASCVEVTIGPGGGGSGAEGGSGGTGGSGGSGGSGGAGGSGGVGGSGGTGGVEVDGDGDGYGSSIDCDDTDPGVHPGAFEDPCDGEDDDCDRAADEPPTATRLYFVAYDKPTQEFALYESELDGTDVVLLQADLPQTTFLRSDPLSGDLLLSTVFDGLLRRTPQGSLSVLHADIGNGQGVALDACSRTAYWGQYYDGLYALDLDAPGAATEVIAKTDLPLGAEGVGAVELGPAASSLYFLSIDNDWGPETKLWTSAVDGSGLTSLAVDHPHGCMVVEPVSEKVYFVRANTDAGPRIVGRASLDGSDVEDLFSLPAGWTCGGLAVDPDAGKLYLGMMVHLDPSNTAQLLRMNLDGSSQELLPVPSNAFVVALGAK